MRPSAPGVEMSRRTTMRGNQAAWGFCLSALAAAALVASQAPVVHAPVAAVDARG